MNKHSKSLGWLAAVLVSAGLANLSAQTSSTTTVTTDTTTTTPTEAAAPSSEVVTMSPFTVNQTNDQGYMTANTNSLTRLNESIKDSPMNVQVINAAMIKDLAMVYPMRILNFASDAHDAGGATNFNMYVVIRGFTSLPDDQERDGFRYLSASDLYNVERMDILYGPISVVQGPADPGGQMNVLTKSAVMGKDFTDVTLGTTSGGPSATQGYRATIDYNRSQELGRDNQVALRVNLLETSNPKFTEFSWDRMYGVAIAAKDTWRNNTTFEFKVEYNNTDQLPISATPDRWSGDPGLKGGYDMALARQIPQLYTYYEALGENGPDSIQKLHNLYWEWQLDEALTEDLHLQFRAEISREDEPEDLLVGYGQTLSYVASTNSYTVVRPWQNETQYDQRYNLRGTAFYDFHALDWMDQKIIGGYSLMHTQDLGQTDVMRNDVTNATVILNTPIYPGSLNEANYGLGPALVGNYISANQQTFNHIEAPSWFINASGTYLGGRVKTVVGVSADSVTRTDITYASPNESYAYLYHNVPGPAITSTTSYTANATDPMAGIVVVITPEINFYADTSKSFKPQSAFYPTLNLTTGVVGPSVGPVKGVGYESGFKFDFKNGWSGTIDGYKVLKTNNAQQIDTNTVAALLGPVVAALVQRYYVPGVVQESKGLEVQVAYNPSREITFIGSYAYNDVYTVESAFAPAAVGTEQTVHWKDAANAIFKYTNVDGPLTGLFWGAAAIARNRLYRIQANEYGEDAGYIIPTFFTGYNGKVGSIPYTIQFDMQNVFNKIYIRSYADIGDPRTWDLFVTAHF